MRTEPNDLQLWKRVCDAQQEFEHARYLFFNKAKDKVGVLMRALHIVKMARHALQYLNWTVDEELKKKLLPDLLKLASVAHNNTVLSREIILGIDERQWVVDRIDSMALEILSEGDDEEYLRIAELYAELDNDLLNKQLERCRSHHDPEIRDVARYFDDESSPGSAW